MEDFQTDALSDYSKTTNQALELETSKNSDNAASFLNGCDEIEELDLMDHCDNASLGSNSDVWKGSDSEDEHLDESVERQLLAENDEDAVDEHSEDGSIRQMNEGKQADAIAQEPNEAVPTEETSESLTENEVVEEETEGAPNELVTETLDEVEAQPEANLHEAPVENADEITHNSVTEQLTNPEAEESQKPSDIEAEKRLEPDTELELTTEHYPNIEEIVELVVNVEAESSVKETEAEKSPVEITDPENLYESVILIETKEKDPLALDSTVVKNHTPCRTPNKNNNFQDQDDCQMEYYATDDDDFDPSLLCPELSMEVDDQPVITNNGSTEAGCASPTLYEPMHSSFVDEVTGAEILFDLTEEEYELKRNMYGPINPIKYGRIHCTACNVHLGSALAGQHNRFVHPLLKVLICKECYHFYTSGEFEKDEDGSELYCRWCGQGGQVLCCSHCEYVFCKKCVRTNFGRRKMIDIRNSDSWACFRCNMSQIMTHRVACHEFFEYINREMQRARMTNSAESWSVDYSPCCSGKKRAKEDGEPKAAKKERKRKKTDIDPDYNPVVENRGEENRVADIVMNPANSNFIHSKQVTVVPRSVNHNKDNDVEFVRAIPAPQVAITTIRPPPSNNVPMYRTTFPQQFHTVATSVQPTILRLTPQMAHIPPLLYTGTRVNNFQNRPSNNANMMKHEWFEKAVRAAARVNSHLSYTLTQLNKAQSQAASVEELAVVHNKLQEIFSTSVNSLIQIRKTLRTEFIAGIKTVRLPSKRQEADDDVIIVSPPPTMPMPATSITRNDPLSIVDTSTNQQSKTLNSNSFNKPHAAKASGHLQKPKGGYLKVKSVSELQNVPSECITIPDDLPPMPNQTDIPLATSNAKDQTTTETENSKVSPAINKRKEGDISEKSNVNAINCPKNENKEMRSVTVLLEKIDLVELQKKLAKKCH